jgi:pimeloyl-ACP methyl ester carboxylesterase
MTKRIACLAACLGLITAASATAASTTASTGPAITVPAAQLKAAIDCKGNLAHARKDPVLLLPGTFGWGWINWGWNYQKLLPARGWPACTLSFPANGAGDIQVAAQYVVHAIRMVTAVSGRKVFLMGHSQGGLEARWALRWWPDLRADVAGVITLAAPNGGALYTNQHCNAPSSCATSLYQMKTDSAFMRALNRGRSLTFGLPWVALSTTSDTVFVLPSEAALAGAQNLEIQNLCPAHQVQHVNLAFDGPTSAIVLDALEHGDQVNLGQINHAVCNTVTMPGVTVALANKMLARYQTILAHDLGPDGPRAVGEPPLACYATGSCRTHGRRARKHA